MLERKFDLDKDKAKNVAAVAKSNLGVEKNILFSKLLPYECHCIPVDDAPKVAVKEVASIPVDGMLKATVKETTKNVKRPIQLFDGLVLDGPLPILSDNAKLHRWSAHGPFAWKQHHGDEQTSLAIVKDANAKGKKGNSPRGASVSSFPACRWESMPRNDSSGNQALRSHSDHGYQSSRWTSSTNASQQPRQQQQQQHPPSARNNGLSGEHVPKPARQDPPTANPPVRTTSITFDRKPATPQRSEKSGPDQHIANPRMRRNSMSDDGASKSSANRPMTLTRKSSLAPPNDRSMSAPRPARRNSSDGSRSRRSEDQPMAPSRKVSLPTPTSGRPMSAPRPERRNSSSCRGPRSSDGMLSHIRNNLPMRRNSSSGTSTIAKLAVPLKKVVPNRSISTPKPVRTNSISSDGTGRRADRAVTPSRKLAADDQAMLDPPPLSAKQTSSSKRSIKNGVERPVIPSRKHKSAPDRPVSRCRSRNSSVARTSSSCTKPKRTASTPLVN